MFWYFDYDEPVYRPPSEARSLILQLTYGCSQNNCTFCGMYKTKKFKIRPIKELTEEIGQIPVSHREWVQRVFLADGDALIYPQEGLLQILQLLEQSFPSLNRVGAYASPKSLQTKSVEDLEALRARKLRILYFGLESGDDATLYAVQKGYSSQEMLTLCEKAHKAGMKLSVTAILGLAGSERSREHAFATAEWVNRLSPKYFSLLTLFYRHNEDFFRSLTSLSRGGILEEALELVCHLHPQRTILRSNHVSNILNLTGTYPKDREKIIKEVERAIAVAKRSPDWFEACPDYREERF